jgi:hypothetical protein
MYYVIHTKILNCAYIAGINMYYMFTSPMVHWCETKFSRIFAGFLGISKKRDTTKINILIPKELR